MREIEIETIDLLVKQMVQDVRAVCGNEERIVVFPILRHFYKHIYQLTLRGRKKVVFGLLQKDVAARCLGELIDALFKFVGLSLV